MEGLSPPERNFKPLKRGPPGNTASSHQSVSEARPSGCRASIQLRGSACKNSKRRSKVQLVLSGAALAHHRAKLCTLCALVGNASIGT